MVVRERDDIARAVELLTATGGDEPSVDEHTRRITIAATGGADRLIGVLRDLDEANIAIDDIGLRRPTLDDVFLAITGHAAEEAAGDNGGSDS